MIARYVMAFSPDQLSTSSLRLNAVLPVYPASPSAAVRSRLASIDLLRGLVMVLMALDHTRDFFGPSGMNPRDVAEPALFLTRGITHFCAPIFILLAGVSAWLLGSRDRAVGGVSRYLFTRGLWLLLMEFTLVHVGWTFDLGSGFFITQVIWVIGASMVVLAALVYLPRGTIAGFGLALIAGHNLFDGVRAEQFGAAGWIWNFLHEPKLFQLGGDNTLLALYPLIPWAGVMAAGYVLGPLFQEDRVIRARRLMGFGAGITIGFVVLRATNVYGDPAAWAVQESMVATVLSFLNCEKYPPSLLYLMMTLGPGLILLAAFEQAQGRLAGWLITFGRVPFFYYVAHLFLIHALAVAFASVTTGDASWLFGGKPSDKPSGYGMGLSGVYATTLLVVVILYPLCRWFAALKAHHRGSWWSYL
jgi:uncharacterized membrane protein